jgi:hypothetical protein
VNRFVLDASIALAWFIDRPIAPYAMRVQQWLLRGDRAVVPSVWRLEVANGLVVAERRGLRTPSDFAFALHNFETVLTQSVEEDGLQRRVPRHRQTAKLTARDPRSAIGGGGCAGRRPNRSIEVSYFRYSESFFNSSGMGGNGGHERDWPLSSGVAGSARSVPSCTAILCGFPAV